MLKILFLDQSGRIGGAELSLGDIAKAYRDNCLVVLFQEGNFQQYLDSKSIPVITLTISPIKVRKKSNIWEILSSLKTIFQLIKTIFKLVHQYDLIYANTPKALVVGACVSLLSRRPLIYHLHDILSSDHFSWINRYVAVQLANHCTALVIANSQATQTAFIAVGGDPSKSAVVYNGFEVQKYRVSLSNLSQLKKELGLEKKFIIGHFSRLSPWKGQHLLLMALVQCPQEVAVIFVGDDLFSEEYYQTYLLKLVKELGLKERVKFLGFQNNVIPWMQLCDLITHTSILPEPLGRVIIEAMLCGKPVIASNAGGATELIEQYQTGWLVAPGNAEKLAQMIINIQNNLPMAKAIATTAQIQASQKFDLETINQQIIGLIEQTITNQTRMKIKFPRHFQTLIKGKS